MSDPKDSRIRLVLVDELGLFRASLARFLGSEPDFEVTGQCGDYAEAIDLLKTSSPDIVLLDFEIGAEHATDLLLAARQAGYQGRFLIVAGAADARKSALALKAGASGIFLKSEPPERLTKAIKVVADGGAWVDSKVIQLLASQLIDPYPALLDKQESGPALDERERNVLLGILSGLSNRRIGDNLGMSESKVKGIVQRLFSKSGVKTRGQLVRVALEGSLGSGRALMNGGRAESTAAERLHGARDQGDPVHTISQSHD